MRRDNHASRKPWWRRISGRCASSSAERPGFLGYFLEEHAGMRLVRLAPAGKKQRHRARQLAGGPSLLPDDAAGRTPPLEQLEHAALDAEHLAGDARRVFAREEQRQRRDVGRVERVEAVVGRHETAESPFRETGARAGGDGVARHFVLRHLHGDYLGERRDARFGGAVVALPGIAQQARWRGGVDDAATRVAGLSALAE